LALERERVQATKIEAEATLIKAKNDAKSFELTKMVEEAKILSMLLEGMDPLIKTWYMIIRDHIVKELMSAHEPLCSCRWRNRRWSRRWWRWRRSRRYHHLFEHFMSLRRKFLIAVCSR
jgi:hypothetical protein